MDQIQVPFIQMKISKAYESVAKPIFKRIIHSPKYGTIEKL